MTAEIQLALIATIPPTLVALGTMISSFRAHTKLDHITVLTNSTLSEAKLRIALLERQLAEMSRSKEI